jgi:hypothetical protein
MATTIARATPMVTKIIDGDGHIYERDEDIIPYLRGKYPEETLRTYYLFPTLDGWRRGRSCPWPSLWSVRTACSTPPTSPMSRTTRSWRF